MRRRRKNIPKAVTYIQTCKKLLINHTAEWIVCKPPVSTGHSTPHFIVRLPCDTHTIHNSKELKKMPSITRRQKCRVFIAEMSTKFKPAEEPYPNCKMLDSITRQFKLPPNTGGVLGPL